jgi:hypothetical protein
MVLFIALPFVGFWLGMEYAKEQVEWQTVDTIEHTLLIDQETDTEEVSDSTTQTKWEVVEDIVPGLSIDIPPEWVIRQEREDLASISNVAEPSPISDEALQTESHFVIRTLSGVNPRRLPISEWFDVFFSGGFAVEPWSREVVQVAGKEAVRIGASEIVGPRYHHYVARDTDIIIVAYGLYAEQFLDEYETMLNSIAIDAVESEIVWPRAENLPGGVSFNYPPVGDNWELTTERTEKGIVFNVLEVPDVDTGVPIPQYSISYQPNTKQQSLLDWFSENVDLSNTIIPAGNFDLSILSNGIGILLLTGEIPPEHFEVSGPIPDLYAISPSGDYVVAIQTMQGHKPGMLGGTPEMRLNSYLAILESMEFQ